MRPFMKNLTLAFLMLILACGILAQSKNPKFEDYSVSENFSGQPAAAKIFGRDARMYRTRITEGAKSGPNFAGHYTIVKWGCGSDCLGFAIVNAKTGAVYFSEGFWAVLRVAFQTEEHFEFKRDSQLLIISGSRIPSSGRKGWSTNDAAKFYYRWTGKRLVLIKSSKLGFQNDEG
jgi:hypothetical protein